MRTVGLLAVLAVFVAAYIIWVRPYLKSLPQFAELYRNCDSLWGAIKVWLDGRRTILIGLWGELIALGPDILLQIGGLDLKTLLGLPDQWAMWINAFIPVLMIIFRAKAR